MLHYREARVFEKKVCPDFRHIIGIHLGTFSVTKAWVSARSLAAVRSDLARISVTVASWEFFRREVCRVAASSRCGRGEKSIFW